MIKRVFTNSREKSLKFTSLSRNFFLIICVTLIFTSIFVADSTAQNSITDDKNHLTIISPHWDGIKREFESAFIEHIKTTENREITISWLDIGGGSEIIKYINQQFQINKETANIDLLFGGGTDIFHQTNKLGYLTPANIKSELLSRIPKTLLNNPLYDEKLNWISVAFAGFGIIFNKKAIEILKLTEPLTWEDLARPEYFNLVGIGDPRRSASAHMIIEIILQAYGWDKGWNLLQRIAKNTRTFTTSSSQALKDLSVGDVVYGVVIDSYAKDAREIAGEENIGYVIPKGMSIYNGDPVAILKGSPNFELAEKFVNFLLTDKAQKIMSFKLGSKDGPKHFEIGKLPMLESLYVNERENLATSGNPYELSVNFQYNPTTSANRWSIINEIVGLFLINNQDFLKRIAIKNNKASSSDSFLEQKSFPITENEVEKIYKSNLWKDNNSKFNVLRDWEVRLKKYCGDGDDGKMLDSFWKFVKLFPLLFCLLIWGRRIFNNDKRS